MKKLLFLFAFLPTVLFSQIYVEGVDINADEEIQYCQISVVVGFKRKLRMVVDYGQKIDLFTNSMKIKNKDEEIVKFKSIVGLMNFMDKNDWELITSFYHPDQLREKYTFGKRKNSYE